MRFRANGLILKESPVGEGGRVVSILTSDMGLINALVRGAGNIRGKTLSSTQMFAYSQFVLYKGRGGYIVNEADVQNLFFGLRSEVDQLSLGQYFCEIALALSPENGSARDFLRLILNCLHYLEKGLKKSDVIKSIFEFRMCAMSGYMPDLIGCRGCGTYESKEMNFAVNDGLLICSSCINKYHGNIIPLSKGSLDAMRHIIYSQFEKLFSFEVSGKSLNILNCVTERYVISHVRERFMSLDFYKKISCEDINKSQL